MKSVKLNLFYNALLNISKVLFPLITAPYVARVLDANDLGLYSFASTYANYFALVAVLGIPLYGSREISKRRECFSETNKVFNELFSICLFCTISIATVYILSILFIDKLSKDYLVLLILGISLYCSPLNIDWFYGGIEDFKHITLRSLVVKCLSVIFLFMFVKTKNDFFTYLWISVFYTVANDLWNFIVLYKMGYKVRITIIGLKRHMKPLFILFASSLAVSVYTILDTVMLGFMSVYVEVAYYSYAMQLSKTLLAAITSLSAVAVPRISYYMNNKQYIEIDNLVNKSLSFVSFLAFPIALSVALLSPTFIPLFLGGQFIGAVLPLQILSSLVIFIGLNNLFGTQCLAGIGLDRYLLYSVLAGTFANFILNIFLIPLYGAIGASIASAIAELIVLLFSLYFVIKYTKIKLKFSAELIKTILSTLTLLPVFLFLNLWLDGWILVANFAFLSSLIYLFFQKVMKNQAVLVLEDMLVKKWKS